MCRNVSECRAIQALLSCANHKSGFVRSRVASHIDSVVESPGAQAALLANWQCLEKLFKAVGGFLNEGRSAVSCVCVCVCHNCNLAVVSTSMDESSSPPPVVHQQGGGNWPLLVSGHFHACISFPSNASSQVPKSRARTGSDSFGILSSWSGMRLTLTA